MEEKNIEEDKQVPRQLGKFLIFLFRRIHKERKWRLLPLWVLLATLGLILFLSGNGAMLPAVYLAF